MGRKRGRQRKNTKPKYPDRLERLQSLKTAQDWAAIAKLLERPRDTSEAGELIDAYFHLEQFDLALRALQANAKLLQNSQHLLPYLLLKNQRLDDAIAASESLLQSGGAAPLPLMYVAEDLSADSEQRSGDAQRRLRASALRVLERAFELDLPTLDEAKRLPEQAYEQLATLLLRNSSDNADWRAQRHDVLRRAYERFHSDWALERYSDGLEPDAVKSLLEQAKQPWNAPDLAVQWSVRLLKAYVLLGDIENCERMIGHPNVFLSQPSARWLRSHCVLRRSGDGAATDLRAAWDFLAPVPLEWNPVLKWSLAMSIAAAAGASKRSDLSAAVIEHVLGEVSQHFWSITSDWCGFVEMYSADQQSADVVYFEFESDEWGQTLEAFVADAATSAAHKANASLWLAMMATDGGDEEVAVELAQAAIAELGDTLWSDWVIATYGGAARVQEQIETLQRLVPAMLVQLPDYDPYLTVTQLQLDALEQASREEVIQLHRTLLTWPDAVPDSLVRETQLNAWKRYWRANLKKHSCHKELVEAAQTITARTPGDAEAWFTLGYHALELNDAASLRAAVSAFETYLDLKPDTAPAANNLGVAFHRLDDLERALGWFTRAAELDPNDANASKNIERVRAQLEQRTPAPGLSLRFSDGASPRERALAQHYWAWSEGGGWTHPLKELGSRFGLSSNKVKDAVIRSAWALSATIACDGCSKPYVYTSRQDYEAYGSGSYAYTCSSCDERRAAQRKLDAEAALVAQRQVVQARFEMSALAAVSASTLSLEDAVNLLSLVRAGANEDMRSIEPLRTYIERLGPLHEYSRTMVEGLHQKGLLVVHPASAPGAFAWRDGAPVSPDLDAVHWGIPMGGPQLPFVGLIEEIEGIFRGGASGWPQRWRDDVEALWRKIVLAEAIRHLHLCMSEHGFQITVGEKTLAVMRTLIERFTLAQVWGIVWSNTEKAAAYYQRERTKISRNQAANSVVSRLQSYADRAIAEGWDLYSARRDRRTDQPVVAQVLFATALHLGVAYQTTLVGASAVADADLGV
jgi:tetratricopeptide (TPR) repeat protein